MRITILSYKPIRPRRGTLLGFVEIQLDDLVLAGCAVHSSGADGNPWLGLPGRPLVSASGVAMKDERNRLRYEPVARWASRRASEEFRRAAVHALRQAFPAALADDGEDAV